MGFGALRTLATGLSFDFAHGVSAVVRLADDDPITTTGIWIAPVTDGAPVGGTFSRQEPRRILALRRSAVPSCPKGTLIVAPPQDGDEDMGWKVDGVDRVEPDHIRVIVVEYAEVLEF